MQPQTARTMSMFVGLRIRPDVVDLARLSLANNQLQGACVIFDMEPVTHILAVAVDGDGLPSRAARMVTGISFSGIW